VPSPFSNLIFVRARALALAVLGSTFLVGVADVARADASTAPTVGAATTATGHGYWSVQSDGTVSSFGDAKPSGNALAPNVVGIAPTKSGNGYWLATADGNVLTFGDAVPHGSLAFRALSQPILGITATPSGKGYRMVASDGGIFSFGDAHFYGSTGNIRLNEPVVGVAPTPTGRGYWMVASDGGIFSFGDAKFFGSIGGRPHAAPIAQFVKTPKGNGYWEFAFDGGVFTFGAAHFYGSNPHPFVPRERDFVFPFEDHAAPAPASAWTQDQGVDVFLKNRGADACGSISQPSRRDGPVLVAVAAGTIVGEGIGGFGPSAPVLHVEHGPLTGMYVYYGHTSGDLVGVGAHVVQGQPLTHVGCGVVGQSNEPHVEIGMGPSYPGLTPCGAGCHGSPTSAAMLHWLLTTQ
jgi:ribosomal protein L24E